MSRSPVVGDIIRYQTSLNDKGKLCAINAKIDGVSQILTVAPIDRQPRTQKSSVPQPRPHAGYSIYRPRYKKSGYGFIPVLLLVAAVSVFSKFTKQNVSSSQQVLSIAEASKPIQQFQCQGKVHCSDLV